MKSTFDYMLKIIVSCFIAIILLYIGLIIGYSLIGDGNVIDALNLSAVKHIINLLRM